MKEYRAAKNSKNWGFRATKTGGNLLKLFSVTVTHNYYTLNHGLCSDFAIRPTPTTASLMLSLGLILRSEEAGFSIFIPQERQQDLVSYLRQNIQTEDPGSGYWERLTFSMQLINPLFVGITALPIDIKTSQGNLYACNIQAHQNESSAVRLPSGNFVGSESLYPLVGNEFTLTLPATTAKVTVLDISGATAAPAEGSPPITISQSGTKKYALLNLDGLPYDLYTITAWDANNQSLNESGYPRKVLYVAPQPDALVLVNILFTQPTPSAAGIYPIPSLFDPDDDLSAWQAVTYQLPFNARSTYWQYFIVSQNSLGELSNLEIHGAGSQFQQTTVPTPLPDGSMAMVFTTAKALPLRQKSPQHFQLKGLRRDVHGQENAIVIGRLPVAASTPVWPAPDEQPISGLSEIFVYV